MKQVILFVLILASLSCNSQTTQAPFTLIKSGEYRDGTLNLAVDYSDSTITGYFEESIERSGSWFCSFYFKGTFENDTFRIVIGDKHNFEYKSELINGKIFGNNVDITLTLNEAIDADCWRVIKGAEFQGFTFGLEQAAEWSSIKIIKEKAYFHSAPNVNSRRAAYVIPNDLIYVKEEKSGWVLAEFHGKSVTTGWIESNKVKN